MFLDRRTFCAAAAILGGSAIRVPAATAIKALTGTPAPEPTFEAELDNVLDLPFYDWPETLLSYSLTAEQVAGLHGQSLVETVSGASIPFQLVQAHDSHHLCFLSDLGAGKRKHFALTAGQNPPPAQSVKCTPQGKSIVLNSGTIQVKIPATQTVTGTAPGPIEQVARNGTWYGRSTFHIPGIAVEKIETSPIILGPLLTEYRVTYRLSNGTTYIATIGCTAGLDFIRLSENMEALPDTATGVFTFHWDGCPFSHRQAPNNPFPFPAKPQANGAYPTAVSIDPSHRYEDYPWEKLDDPLMNTHIGMMPALDDAHQWAVAVGIYEPWPAFSIVTSANFWSDQTHHAAGIFIDRPELWNDHEYAIWKASPKLAVRFDITPSLLTWRWPIVKGSRSCCITFYDHQKDIDQMKRIERYAAGVTWTDGLTYVTALSPSSYPLYLQNIYGGLDLNVVKDWILTYPDDGRVPPYLFLGKTQRTPAATDADIARNAYTNELIVSGMRQNNGFGPTGARQIEDHWLPWINFAYPSMTPHQRKRVTAICLLMAYVHADEPYMPMRQMLSGHPNFLADCKSTQVFIAWLFPDHPQVKAWTAVWDAYLDLNTRYHTRPEVKQWECHGGRWTEAIGTYVWAFVRPSLRAAHMLNILDGEQHLANPQIMPIGDWLVNALSAPFTGETAQSLSYISSFDNHTWGVVLPGQGPKRLHPPHGAHSERRQPPREMWYLGNALRNFAPIHAEHLMWAAQPDSPEMEMPVHVSMWDFMYRPQQPNHGTNPHLKSSKYTGYGVVLRAGVGTKDEISVHLQQVDDGPNYRWGVAGENGSGVVYFVANGRSYSHNGTEDEGDRSNQDTDFSTNFGVWKLIAPPPPPADPAIAEERFPRRDGQAPGAFRSIGENVLSQPMHALGVGQFAELLSRQGSAPYSWPEYISRSLLLAGGDYFLLYDRLFNQVIAHRFSWFIRKGDEFPLILSLKGQGGGGVPDPTRFIEIQTSANTGRWYDGFGDSLVLVSHRFDLNAEPTPYGCRVHGPGIDDTVFCGADPVTFDQAGIHFQGTMGLIRTRDQATELALFRGTRIGFQSFTLHIVAGDLAISAILTPDGNATGLFHATGEASFTLTPGPESSGHTLSIAGANANTRQQGDLLIVSCPPGLHPWEWKKGLPTPIAPTIQRTESLAGAVRIVATPVPSATFYHLEWSPDQGATWSAAAQPSATPILHLNHPSPTAKYHVRVYATNAERRSPDGAEYPIYPTTQPPPPPDGLRIQPAANALSVTWGEVLGVTEYRLYAAPAGAQPKLLYKGLDRTFSYPHGQAVSFTVSSVSGLGEGNPSKPRIFPDPIAYHANETPDRRFRRTTTASESSPPPNDGQPRYYPA